MSQPFEFIMRVMRDVYDKGVQGSVSSLSCEVGEGTAGIGPLQRFYATIGGKQVLSLVFIEAYKVPNSTRVSLGS
jgi:hypothetical protein